MAGVTRRVLWTREKEAQSHDLGHYLLDQQQSVHSVSQKNFLIGKRICNFNIGIA